MSNVWFISDLHFEEINIVNHRNLGNTIEEHDETIIDNINKVLGKRDKLFILGDLGRGQIALDKIGRLSGTKELILGNHDQLATACYLHYFSKVHGFRRYKQFWLTHCPIHPQEIYTCRGNIHGHLHYGAKTAPLLYPYFNVNVEYNGGKPVALDTIYDWFNKYEQT